jgi:dihydropyrimidine dehydrogenase (NAD+) subunit PreT
MTKKYTEEIEENFTPITLNEEASRCLLCLDPPCSKACPAGTDPAKFIRSVRFKNIKGAIETVRENNILGGICARVCPTEKYCQKGCSRSGIDKAIDIGRIQKYITDMEEELHMNVLAKPIKNKKEHIAIIGSGPSGLAAAGYLLLKGYHVDIYEKEKELGGYLRYGIPEYRLPNSVVDKEVNRIVSLGACVYTNTTVGKDITLEELEKKYDAVILGIGLNKAKTLSMFMNNPHVVSSISLLKEIKENKGNIKVPNNIIIVGGGDVAMDIATSLKILGSKNVACVVYEEFSEFKASEKELEGARNLDVSIYDGYIPLSVNDNEVTFKHRKIDSEIKMKADLIVLAIGQEVDATNIDVEFDKNEAKTSTYNIKGTNIFAVGDISRNKEKSVVGAVRTAKEVVFEIAKYLGGK